MNKITAAALIMLLGILIALAFLYRNPPFNYAEIYSPDGGVAAEGEIKRYKVGSGGVSIEFADGTVYGTDIKNVILIQDRDNASYINEEGRHDQ